MIGVLADGAEENWAMMIRSLRAINHYPTI
jgi:hypothetical protein